MKNTQGNTRKHIGPLEHDINWKHDRNMETKWLKLEHYPAIMQLYPESKPEIISLGEKLQRFAESI